MPELRIPLEEAIGEARLLRPFWTSLSKPQQTAIRIFYGLPLDTEPDDRGFSGLDYWSAFQGKGTYDGLGYLRGVTPLPYEPHLYPEMWAIVGVRGGKSHICTFISAYEATCGGHEQFLTTSRKGVVFQIAQDMRMARYSLNGVKSVLESMPFISGKGGDGTRRIVNETADTIELWNGMLVSCIPPTVRAIRGYDAPGAVLDEVGVWYNEKESANPDKEVYEQVLSRQAQFAHPFLAAISSPWMMQGMLYQRSLRGTTPASLVIHSTTAAFANPLVTEGWLTRRQESDPRIFARECLALFQASVSGFLDPDALGRAITAGQGERAPQLTPEAGDELPFYTAAMDPAFRHDAFAFTIVHTTGDGTVVQDVVRQWIPAPAAALNPSTIIEEIARLCRAYQISTVYSDQYQMEALNQLAFAHGLLLERVPFSAASKAAIFGSLKVRVHQGKIHLLDHPEQRRELEALEQVQTEGGTVRVSAPRGAHDDLACALALAVHKATWMFPDRQPEAPRTEPTLFELGMQTLQQKRTASALQLEEGWPSPFGDW